MAQANRASRGKRPSKAVSVLGIAGMSLAASTGGSQAGMPASEGPTLGSATDILWQNAAPFRIPMLDEEEISDVSLATFYLYDKDNLGTSRAGIQQAAFRGGCGCGHGCGGGCRGCGGVRGCAVGGCRGCAGGGCRVRRWLSRLRLRRLRRLRRLWRRDLGLGRRLLLVMGRLRPLLDRSALPLR
jgi:hypothetical protein